MNNNYLQIAKHMNNDYQRIFQIKIQSEIEKKVDCQALSFPSLPDENKINTSEIIDKDQNKISIFQVENFQFWRDQDEIGIVDLSSDRLLIYTGDYKNSNSQLTENISQMNPNLNWNCLEVDSKKVYSFIKISNLDYLADIDQKDFWKKRINHEITKQLSDLIQHDKDSNQYSLKENFEFKEEKLDKYIKQSDFVDSSDFEIIDRRDQEQQARVALASFVIYGYLQIEKINQKETPNFVAVYEPETMTIEYQDKNDPNNNFNAKQISKEWRIIDRENRSNSEKAKNQQQVTIDSKQQKSKRKFKTHKL